MDLAKKKVLFKYSKKYLAQISTKKGVKSNFTPTKRLLKNVTVVKIVHI